MTRVVWRWLGGVMTGGVMTRGSEELLIPADYRVPTVMDAHEAHHHHLN